tara:strand:+ start:130 stop:507 length:378 start_codon:yes stop_codon:yes gene_type:complete
MLNKKNKSKLKIIKIILVFIFFIFALLQLNDPDSFFWVFIYLLTGLLILVSNYKIIPKMFLWFVLIAFLVLALFYIPDFINWLQIENKEEIFGEMIYEKSYLEGTREFMGLILAASAIFYVLKQH